MADVSVIIPVYNERNTITPLLSALDTTLRKAHITPRFLIMEDGSSDGTIEILNRLRQKYGLHIDHAAIRRGYRRAVMDGIRKVTTPYTFHVDADGQYDIKDLLRLWEKRSTADVIVGWRTKRHDPASRKLYSGLFSVLWHALFPSKLHDPSCPFVLYNAKAVRPYHKDLTYMHEGFWWGFTAMCIKRGLSVREEPVTHHPRTEGKSRVYLFPALPGISLRNIMGLLRLKVAR